MTIAVYYLEVFGPLLFILPVWSGWAVWWVLCYLRSCKLALISVWTWACSEQ